MLLLVDIHCWSFIVVVHCCHSWSSSVVFHCLGPSWWWCIVVSHQSLSWSILMVVHHLSSVLFVVIVYCPLWLSVKDPLCHQAQTRGKWFSSPDKEVVFHSTFAAKMFSQIESKLSCLWSLQKWPMERKCCCHSRKIKINPVLP